MKIQSLITSTFYQCKHSQNYLSLPCIDSQDFFTQILWKHVLDLFSFAWEFLWRMMYNTCLVYVFSHIYIHDRTHCKWTLYQINWKWFLIRDFTMNWLGHWNFETIVINESIQITYIIIYSIDNTSKIRSITVISCVLQECL